MHMWSVASLLVRDYTLTVQVSLLGQEMSWWITNVYGPQDDNSKLLFLDELRSLRTACSGTWMICGDFNLIYKAQDKNNNNLNRRMMGRFRRFIDDAELIDVHLRGRRFTWSNERDVPTLERLDRVLITDDWVDAFPDHELSAVATECSDHAPLLLRTDCSLPHFKRLRFKNFWPKCEGYLNTVEEAWNSVPSSLDVGSFRLLDCKLRQMAKALKSWSAKSLGSVRLQLAIAKEIVLRLDSAQDIRTLSDREVALRRKAKLCSLGLASLQGTIARQRARITYLAEGHANTKNFHLQACHRSRKV